MNNTHKFRSILEARRAELQARLVAVERDLDQRPDPDVEERAVEREGDEVLEGLGNAGLRELEQIDAALGRIGDGSYGYCVTCGEEISQERLELVPHAPKCRRCA